MDIYDIPVICSYCTSRSSSQSFLPIFSVPVPCSQLDVPGGRRSVIEPEIMVRAAGICAGNGEINVHVNLKPGKTFVEITTSC